MAVRGRLRQSWYSAHLARARGLRPLIQFHLNLHGRPPSLACQSPDVIRVVDCGGSGVVAARSHHIVARPSRGKPNPFGERLAEHSLDPVWRLFRSAGECPELAVPVMCFESRIMHRLEGAVLRQAAMQLYRFSGSTPVL